MGWDGTPIGRNIKTKDFIKWEYDKAYTKYDVIAIGEGAYQFGEKPFYLALKDKETGAVIAVVVLTKRKNGWIYTKSIDEHSGPHAIDCPATVFNLLTPTESAWANEWRAKVSEFLATPKVKVAIGDTVVFEKAHSFFNGYTGTHFTYAGGSKFYAETVFGKTGYRITNWKSYPHSIKKGATL